MRRGFYYAGPATWNSLPHMTDNVNVTVQLSETVEDTSVSLTLHCC